MQAHAGLHEGVTYCHRYAVRQEQEAMTSIIHMAHVKWVPQLSNVPEVEYSVLTSAKE